MKNEKRLPQITEEEYSKYLKGVEEIEALIVAAQKSCEQIERMKKQSISNLHFKKASSIFRRKKISISIKNQSFNTF